MIAYAQRYRPRWSAHVTLAVLVGGTALAAAAVVQAPVDMTRIIDPRTGVVHGQGFPEPVRLITPLFNIAGAAALILGAAYSGWQFWRRRYLPRRAASSALVAIGGLIPSLTSTLSRFELSALFHLGTLLGLVCIFGGFLVSTEVFARRGHAASTPAPECAEPGVGAGPSHRPRHEPG